VIRIYDADYGDDDDGDVGDESIELSVLVNGDDKHWISDCE